MADYFTVNSIQSCEAYKKQVERWFDEHGYLTFPEPRIGPDRSLDQNALFHVFLTDAAAYYLSKHKKDVTPTDVESMKITVKRHFYGATRQAFMVETIADIWGTKTKETFTSSKRWKRGEMFMVLEWLQNKAAQDGLILESKGEFAKNQRESMV